MGKKKFLTFPTFFCLPFGGSGFFPFLNLGKIAKGAGGVNNFSQRAKVFFSNRLPPGTKPFFWLFPQNCLISPNKSKIFPQTTTGGKPRKY